MQLRRAGSQGGAVAAAADAAAVQADAALLAAVVGRGAAVRHAAAVARYLLAGAGDFAWALLAALAPHLDGLVRGRRTNSRNKSRYGITNSSLPLLK